MFESKGFGQKTMQKTSKKANINILPGALARHDGCSLCNAGADVVQAHMWFSL